MGFVQRRLVKCVMAVVAWPKITVALCAALVLFAAISAWQNLSLSTDQDALLTPNLPFFKEYLKFDSKFPESEAFVVLAEPRDYGHLPESKRWMSLADAVSAKLMAMKGIVKRVDSHVPLEAMGNQGLMFDEWDDVRSESAEMQRMLPLLQIMVGKPGTIPFIEAQAQRVFGTNMVARFYGAMGGGPANEGRDFALLVTKSLDAALEKPAEEWKKGRELPDLTELDSRAKYDPSRYGYYMIPDESKRSIPAHKNDKIMIINVFDERDYSSLADVTEPLKLMRAAVKEVAAGYPEFYVGITGRPALEADEMATSDFDMKVAETCGLTLVFIVMWIFLRKLWLVVVAEICLGVGIGWTFGWATYAVGRLNLLSLVFVIALIGIGMDYLIQILTRYRFEKKRYARPQAIWARVFRYVSPPISTACLGAAGAFFAASFTQFRGAAELGVIAGGGLLLCLTAGYTLLPALLTIFPADVGRVAEEDRYHDPAAAPRAGGWRLGFPIAWVLVAAVGFLIVGLPPFDPNLLKLQATGLESVQLVHKLPTWSAAVMTTDLNKLRKARAAYTPDGGGPSSTILKTDSILDAMDKQAWMAEHNKGLAGLQWQEPAPVKAQDLGRIASAAESMAASWEKDSKGPEMAQLRAAVNELKAQLEKGGEEVRARMEEWQRALWGEFKANAEQFIPGPLNVARLPPEVRDHYVSYLKGEAEPRSELNAAAEKEASKPTYALYIYPKADLWEQGRLAAFVHELEQRQEKAGSDLPVTGVAVELLYSTEAIHRAFLLSAAYALGLIFVLVLLDFRRLGQTLAAISVLALGLPMLIVLMACWRWMGEPFGIPGNWNFANFFGLPILIGAGHEYGVFMVHRYRETLHDPRRLWRRWDVSDRALLLCAIVTSCSFGFLMLASHRGLASLGWVMAVGSGCIYLATILVLRPVLQWQLKRRGVYGNRPAKKVK